MPVVPVPRWLWAILLALTALTLEGSAGSGSAGPPPAPSINEPIVATFHAGKLTLTGTDLGEAPAARSIKFAYGDRSVTISADSPLVHAWSNDSVSLSLPPQVQSGQLTLLVGGVASEPVDLLVFARSPTPAIPPPRRPLALDVGPDGQVWVNAEYHTDLRTFSPEAPPTNDAMPIPQAEGPGIFALTIFGDNPSRISGLGEDVAVDADGDVWFTQGGASLYDGEHFNTSRVIQYESASEEFRCFTAPVDNAQATGILVDEPRGMVWYAEASIQDGNAITGFRPDGALADCFFEPGSDPRPPVCSEGVTDPCHQRFPLPDPSRFPAHLALDTDGNIWFTEFWRSRIGRLTPETGEIIELPMPQPINARWPALFLGSGPWELMFDEHGDLWVSEFFDATIVRVRPSLMESEDCEHRDAEDNNPCMEEIVVASDGTDGATIHTHSQGADGLIWFAVSSPDGTRIGFISPDHDHAVTYLPTIEDVPRVAGIVQDRESRDIWFAQPADKEIGRLRQIGIGDFDADGVPDLEDNCVTVINEAQSDFNADGLGDVCDYNDTDGDGCANALELGSDPELGGARDPLDFWDFYDVPGTDNVRDGGVSGVDIGRVLSRFGAQGDPTGDPLAGPIPPAPAYHPAFDRAGPGSHVWASGPADGGIFAADIVSLIVQFGHDCSWAPTEVTAP